MTSVSVERVPCLEQQMRNVKNIFVAILDNISNECVKREQ